MPAWYTHEPCQEMLSMVIRKTCVNLLHHDEPCPDINLTVMASILRLHPWQTIHVSIWAPDLA